MQYLTEVMRPCLYLKVGGFAYDTLGNVGLFLGPGLFARYRCLSDTSIMVVLRKFLVCGLGFPGSASSRIVKEATIWQDGRLLFLFCRFFNQGTFR